MHSEPRLLRGLTLLLMAICMALLAPSISYLVSAANQPVRLAASTATSLKPSPGEIAGGSVSPALGSTRVEDSGIPALGRDESSQSAASAAEAGTVAGETTDVDEAAASCGGMSFTADTKVLLASGAAIPISKLKLGDKVLATNVKTGKTQAEPVTTVLLHHDTDLYDLTVKSAYGTAIINTTSSHLFWTPEKRQWVKAASLRVGEQLKTPGGATAYADGGAVPANHDGWMWDLSVPGGGDHDFYVVAGSASTLVHNCDPAPSDSAEPDVTFGHGARHLAGTGLDQEDVESAIETQVKESVSGSSSTGSFWGRVTVGGQIIEYRAYTLPNGVVNVGTYYVPR